MSGAYTAKPGPTVGVPPGWPPNDTHVPGGPYPPEEDPPLGHYPSYPYPGEPGVPDGPDPYFPNPPFPYPPGYESDYSMVMAYFGTAVTPGDIIVITNSVRDHSTYPTPEPSPVIWTASINDSPIRLKFSGEEFNFSINKSTSFLDFWDVEVDIIFELDSDDLGKTLVLVSETTVEGETITTAVSILIGTFYSATLNVTWPTPSNLINWVGSYPESFFRIVPTIRDIPVGIIAYESSIFRKISNGNNPTFDWLIVENSSSGVAISGGDLSMIAQMDSLEDVNGGASFQIGASMKNFSGKCDGSGSLTLITFKNGSAVSSTNLELSVTHAPYVPDDNRIPWLTVNVDGTVIVDNP